MFHLIEKAFNQVTFLVHFLIDDTLLSAIFLAGDDGYGGLFLQKLKNPVRIISAVGQDLFFR